MKGIVGALCAILPLTLATSGEATAQILSYAEIDGGPRLDYAALDIAEAQPGLQPPGAIAPAEDQDSSDGRVADFFLDRLEWIGRRGDSGYTWDASALIGSERNRLFIAATGDGTFGGALDYLETQLLYSRNIGSDWELQAGLRYDFIPRPKRAYFTLGAQGNATESLYLGALGFLSHKGELSSRFFGVYDLEIAPSLIVQPSLETEIYAQDVPELGIGSGFTYADLGLRLRYEVREEFAPYVGIGWERLLGRTARMAQEEGEELGSPTLLVGLRSWF